MNLQKKKIYLAGPDVFFPNANKILASKKKICDIYGFIGISPLDNDICTSIIADIMPTRHIIMNSNKALIETCDIVIANFNSFRGFEPDSGTCFEIGYATALKKDIYLYLDNYQNSLSCRYANYYQIENQNLEYDLEGNLIENYGFPVNLMFSNAKIAESFEDCLRLLIQSQ